MKTCVCRKEITGCLCSISSVIVFSSFLCFFTARKYAQPQRRKLCSCALKDTLQGLLYFWVNSIKSPERQTHQPTMRLRSDWCPGAVMTPVLINVLVPKGGGFLSVPRPPLSQPLRRAHAHATNHSVHQQRRNYLLTPQETQTDEQVAANHIRGLLTVGIITGFPHSSWILVSRGRLCPSAPPPFPVLPRSRRGDHQ